MIISYSIPVGRPTAWTW